MIEVAALFESTSNKQQTWVSLICKYQYFFKPRTCYLPHILATEKPFLIHYIYVQNNYTQKNYNT